MAFGGVLWPAGRFLFVFFFFLVGFGALRVRNCHHRFGLKISATFSDLSSQVDNSGYYVSSQHALLKQIHTVLGNANANQIRCNLITN